MTADPAVPAGWMRATAIPRTPRDPRAVARIVEYLLDTSAGRHTIGVPTLRAEITDAVQICLALLGHESGGERIDLTGLRDAAAQWVGRGVPLELVQKFVHRGFRFYLEMVQPLQVVTQPRHYSADAHRLLETVHVVTSSVAAAYDQYSVRPVDPGHSAANALAAALLAGRRFSTVPHAEDVPIDDRYTVLAVAISSHPEERPRTPEGRAAARRKVQRVLASLENHCGQAVPELLNPGGGTILVPLSAVPDDGLDRLLTEITTAARVPITAAAVTADTAEIPVAADQAHELLDILARLHSRPGVYRFDDLALEYQLTRPGRGRESLAAQLDPLDEYPDLLDTLREYVRNDLSRARTSKLMHIHPNTLDNRLRRILALTGLDTVPQANFWRVRAALVARTYASG
ncbi:PucR family transcriptional regulator [Nocardia jejuensis]|uniref:PucR family transcriptional regulator n=1 Tax=Nocardia jejuensis TaxID=328049 RepID=UPI00082AF546|nr:helix-turn-helix domain-containing protein [Nocardia jejuensis]